MIIIIMLTWRSKINTKYKVETNSFSSLKYIINNIITKNLRYICILCIPRYILFSYFFRVNLYWIHILFFIILNLHLYFNILQQGAFCLFTYLFSLVHLDKYLFYIFILPILL